MLALCGVTAPVRSKRAPAPSHSASGMPGPLSTTARIALAPSRATASVTGGGAVAEGVVDEVLAGLGQRQRVGAAGHRVLAAGRGARSSASASLSSTMRMAMVRRSTVSCGTASARWMISAWLSSWSVSRPRPTARAWMRADDGALAVGVGLVGGELGLGADGGDRGAQLVRGVGDQVAHDLDLPRLAGHEAVDRARRARRSRAARRRRAASGRAARGRRARSRSGGAAPAPSGWRARRARPSRGRSARRRGARCGRSRAASASRARVVWPTTTSTVPVKSRSEKRRRNRGEPARSRRRSLSRRSPGSPPVVRGSAAGDEPALGAVDGVEHPVVGGERQELEGRGRDVDEDLARAHTAPRRRSRWRRRGSAGRRPAAPRRGRRRARRRRRRLPPAASTTRDRERQPPGQRRRGPSAGVLSMRRCPFRAHAARAADMTGRSSPARFVRMVPASRGCGRAVVKQAPPAIRRTSEETT